VIDFVSLPVDIGALVFFLALFLSIFLSYSSILSLCVCIRLSENDDLHDTMIPSILPTEIFYVVREETTYTYDRDDNTNDDESVHTGRLISQLL
jgi:hypothetical protein